MLQCLGASVLRRPQCLDTPCIGALGASETRCLGASAPSVLGCSLLRCPRYLSALVLRCLGIQHASSALGDETFCTICAASQPWNLCRRLAEFTGVASSASRALCSIGSPILSPPPSAFKPFTEHTLHAGSSLLSSQPLKLSFKEQ
ncbi:UNVERIFIED_CONTAM: hypothetical protein FKN15_000179 [Acipenser sinensis]